MKQFESMNSLLTLKRERVLKIGRCSELTFEKKVSATGYLFSVQSGLEFLEQPQVADFQAFKHILVAHSGVQQDSSLTPDIQFEDISLSRFNSKRKLSTPVVAGLHLCEICEVDYKGLTVTVEIQPKLESLKQGQKFFLRERYVDWNLSKVVDILKKLDKMENQFYLQLILNPVSFGHKRPFSTPNFRNNVNVLQKVFGDLSKLHPQFTEFLFKKTQFQAFELLVDKSLAIVHGPPGSGKTHCLALSALWFIVLVYISVSEPRPFRVLMTAFTNAAIDAFLQKVTHLFQIMREAQTKFGLDFPKAKLGQLIENLSPNIKKLTDEKDMTWIKNSQFCIAAGTAWKAYKLSEPVFDLVVIDEASQYLMADAVIPISLLAPQGRLLIGGDHHQLQPILATTFPKLGRDQPQIFSSVLECVRRNEANLSPDYRESACHTVILSENFRMVASVADHINTLYPTLFEINNTKRLRPVKNKGVQLEQETPKPVGALISAMKGSETQDAVKGRLSIQFSNTALTADLSLALQAQVATQIVSAILHEFGSSVEIFIVTPHRTQRAAISKALAARVGSEAKVAIKVDTVERMQGQECDVLLAFYTFFDLLRISHELPFIFNINRLNVALSRARFFSVLLCSAQVLTPPLEVFGDSETQKAFQFLASFFATSSQISWPIDLQKLAFSAPKNDKTLDFSK